MILVCQCEKAKVPATEAKPITEQKPNETPAPAPPKPVPLVVAPTAELQKELLAIVNRWNVLPSQVSGKELLAKQRELAYEGAVKLAGGAELTHFLRFLKSKGGVDLHNELIERGMMDAFRVKGEAMWEWVLSVEDFKMKESLMIQAGMACDGTDIAANILSFCMDNKG